ncbi:MAG: hypothetical protein H7257_06280 [Taibaiella sp.]|nr:hypothetical protein [Taibaiella sp.]
MNKLFRFSVFMVAATLFFSCGQKGADAPDVSGIQVDLKTYRFDHDIYAIDTNHLSAALPVLKSKYPDFLDFFLDTMMGFNIRGNYNDTVSGVREGFHELVAYKDYVQLQDTINKYYPDTKDVDEDLTKAFKYMKHYFPTSNAPKVIYINHILLNVPVLCVDVNISCICLDMFLGGQFPYYRSIGVPDYLEPHLRKSYIPVAFFSTLYQSTYPYRMDDKTLLERMVMRGKEQYFLHKVMPELGDSTLFGFTATQVDWCSKNEAQIYNFFVQRNLLYNKEEREIGPYVIDGPFARGIGSATDPGRPTPGNIGTWLGYKIITAYMAQYPDKSLAELIAEKTEAASILDQANYRPK